MSDPKAKPLFMKQIMMRRVLYALAPIVAASVYFFGWRALFVQIVVVLCGTLTEYVFLNPPWQYSAPVKTTVAVDAHSAKTVAVPTKTAAPPARKQVSEAVLVTSLLYALILPPRVPVWIAIVGIVFGVVFGKMVFGGFGRNVYNPALVARAFVYVCFPNQMTIEWTHPASGLPGGLGSWLMPAVENVTQATPLIHYRNDKVLYDLWHSVAGFIPGSMGETSKVLILLAAAYLIYKKTAAWQIMAACVLGFVASDFLLSMFSASVIQPIHGLLSGGFLFATVFMATDPISASSTPEGKWIYGILIGFLTVVIRSFALFAEGVMFAILITNTFVPLMDELIRQYKQKKKAKEAPAHA